MKIYLKLLGLGLIIVFFSALFYLLKRKTKFKDLKHSYQQIIIGIVFGGLAVMGTEFGVPVEGATANVRDAAPLCAGLIFGGPAGIIAGLIGGIERFFATYWGRGAYTQIACSVSTIIAGFFAAFLKKYMLDGKRASITFGIMAGIFMEVVHLTFIFITHLNDAKNAIEVVEIVTLPMIFGTAVSVALACLIVNLLSINVNTGRVKEKNLSTQFQKGILFLIVISYLFTTSFVYQVQTSTQTLSVTNLLQINLEDAGSDLGFAFVDGSYGTKDEAIASVLSTRRIGENGYFAAYDKNGNEIYTGGISVKIDKERDVLIKEKIDDKYCTMYHDCDDYVLVGIMTEKEAYFVRDAAIYINSFMEIIIFASLFILLYFLIKKMVVNNINNVNNKLKLITGGNLNERVNINSSQEFVELSRDINLTVEALKGYIDEAASRINKELALAHNIQTSSLPSVFPPFPQIKKFDIYATMSTAKEVGGDFYDFYMIGSDKIAFLIADVSGKGIPAAMFMMQSKTMIKSLAEGGLPVDDVLTIANKKLCENNEAEMFVTVWMGILDINTGVVEFANAGHNPPLLYREGVGFEYFQSKPGLVLAGMDMVKYKKGTLELHPGDRLYLYTDGVTEANDVDDNLYGEERLKNYLNKHYKEVNRDLLDDVKLDIDNFARGREQFDDVTMLIVDYLKDNTQMKKRTFMASTEMLREVTDFIVGELEANNASMASINKIELSLEEIFVNIAHYAYPDGIGEAVITIEVIDDTAKISFIDTGVEFNPLEKVDPDLTLNAKERSIGGLGIFMVKKLMDDVTYEYKDKQNILTITKKIK